MRNSPDVVLFALVTLLSTMLVSGVDRLALGQPPSTDPGGALGHLTKIRPGRSARVSSAAPKRSSNADNRRIPPGKTLVLADIQGPGTIQHIWLTFPEPAPSWLGRDGNPDHSELVLRMYWDGAKVPAVESPVGDFFAAGFGQRAAVNSAPVAVEGGDAYNCYWPMPFFKSARIELENQSSKQLNSFYYQIDYLKEEPLPPDTPYFCAQYRQEYPVQSGRDYLILDAVGRGHYVGTVLSGRARSPMWFGEGDDKFYIDGEKTPSLWGTGTEDYVSNAWGMHLGTFPYFGVSILEGEWDMVGWRTTVYRWHIPDPVRFTKSLRVEIEDAGWITKDELKPGVHEGFVERNDDFATVAFWYQTGQPKRFATLPPAKDRRWPNLDIIVEGKDLLKTAKAEHGTLRLQKGYEWTGDGQLFFDNDHGAGAWVEFSFPVAKEELRQLTLRTTHSYDFGTYRILLDGQEIRRPIDFYSPEVKIRELNLGQRRLPAGNHTLRIECTGKSGPSRGSKLGIDSVRLRQRWDVKREAPKEITAAAADAAEKKPAATNTGYFPVAKVAGQQSEQAKAIAAIEQLGEVTVDEKKPGKPVTKVSFFHRAITDADLAQLKGYFEGLPDLRDLDLSWTPITDTGLVNLERLTGLWILFLAGTKVTDSGLVHLEPLTQLSWLILCDTQVTDAGLTHLKGMTLLKWLNLGNTKVSDAGLIHLKALPRLEVLALNGTEVTDAGLVHLKRLPQLTALGLGPKVTDAGLVHLKALTRLRVLNLEGTKVTDAGLARLNELSQLEVLDLKGTEVTDAGLMHLERLTRLQDVNLTRTRVTDAGLAHVKGLTKLTSLRLRGTKVTPAGVNSLRKAMPGLKIEF